MKLEISNIMQKGFDKDPVFDEKYLGTKAKSYGSKINTNFHGKIISEESNHCVCLSVTLLDSVYKIGKSYYPQVYLEECKYVAKENKVAKYVDADLELDSSENFDVE